MYENPTPACSLLFVRGNYVPRECNDKGNYEAAAMIHYAVGREDELAVGRLNNACWDVNETVCLPSYIHNPITRLY
jgi:hypothetical protein